MNYINTATGEYPVSESDIRAAYPNTSFSVPFVAPEGYVFVFPTPQPEFNPVIQRVQETAPALTVKGHYEQQWEVVPRFAPYTDDMGVVRTVAAQEAAAIAADQASKVAAKVKAIEAKVEALWAAADKYISSYISGVAIGILTVGVMKQKPKALAVTAWSSAIWSEYYARKALVTVYSVDNHDFSSFGPIPYSVPELQAEIGQ